MTSRQWHQTQRVHELNRPSPLLYGPDCQHISVEQWTRYRDDPEIHRVALDRITYGAKAIVVSTVWLGIDHGIGEDGPPLIYETMTFSSPDNMAEDDTWRWHTRDEAEAGHVAVVAHVVADLTRQGHAPVITYGAGWETAP